MMRVVMSARSMPRPEPEELVRRVVAHRVREQPADLLAPLDDARMDAVAAPMRRLGVELLRAPTGRAR